jgi:hypothetical protein
VNSTITLETDPSILITKQNGSVQSEILSKSVKKKKFNYLMLAIPAAMLNCETVCKHIATLLIPASTVQMISGTSIVYSAIL